MSIIPVEVPTGAIRYNTDSNKMECFNGTKWMQVAVSSPDLNGGARGIFTAGATPTKVNTMDYVNIASAGNAIDFGDMTTAVRGHGSCADRTRGLNAGGDPTTVTIDYITISSTGDATDFGDLSLGRNYLAAVNNATRGVWGGAWGPNRSNVIDYVTIQSTGDAKDFGDLLTAKQTDGSFSSPIRGFWVGGASGSGPTYDASTSGTVINFITTSSTGNAHDFGDLINGTFGKVGASNSIRGLAGGGYGSPANILALESITMATLGNAINFGDMTNGHYYGAGTSDPIRAIFGGGTSANDIIDYVTIATEGDAVDFGNLTTGRESLKGLSNGNGGL